MQPTKWQIQLILAQKIIFCHLLKYLSKMDLSAVLTLALSDYHWLRRPLHGLLHRSCIAVVYPTLELICELAFKIFSLPVPLHEVFVTTRPDPVPKSKTTSRQSLAEMNTCEPKSKVLATTLVHQPPSILFWQNDTFLPLHLTCVVSHSKIHVRE